ncbi:MULTISPECIES: OB-fold nucleic acid binding domain-containing protein [Aeromicrobium]|uniref:DNA-binding protein n=1 Tax=Aeromicrobium yanjiei TaxID=2662028 RepID=A0A5Q2MDM7_9ACTN|nr:MULTISPECIES: OB-fold nucleic acid binding domain-containing protein [Aeromicrobium]MRK02063.1 DNA-binding protein [Aeromicrobium sp. S22]QGG41207.1 DNA-binding protein [Aeromicrobium yanjiei]
MGRISRTLERLSSEHQEAGELKTGSAKAGCKLIASVPDRAVVTIHGVLRSVTLRPVDGVTALEAELYDGSDSVTLIWLGRRKIEGVRAGRHLKASGRVGMRGTTRVLYNPRYELDA